MEKIMLALLAPLLLGAPAGWESFDSGGGCTYFKSPKHASGYPTLRAECSWSDVTPDTLDALLTDLEGHDELHSSIAEAKVVEQTSGGNKVYQRHVASGISDREAHMEYTRSVSGDTITHAWSMTSNQPTPSSGNEVPAHNSGKWELSPDGSGSKVVYELRYEPGGSVPGFVVRAFQTSGLVTIVQELHKAGLKAG